MQSVKTCFLFALLSSLLNLYAQSQSPAKNYENEWKIVTSNFEKNLPKSALEQVKKIYTLAKKENQDAQVIKALVYMTGLQAENRENNEILSIQEIEKEILAAKEPAASILKSLLADMYWQYFQNNRWRLYSRTATIQFKKDDIATWSTEDFHKKISELYLQSVKDEKLLQQTKPEPFDAIIAKGNVRHLRPTLFDLLAHRAISYFDNNERDIKRPDYAFEIEQAHAFDQAADFIKAKFPAKDSLSLHHKSLLIYQRLLAFHINDPKPDALIDADLLRIEFVNNNSTHPDKDKLYFNAINHIARQYENYPAAAQAWYLIANYFNEKAETYKPYSDSTHRLDRIKAKEICEKVLAQKDSSEGRINCYNLLSTINSRSLSFNVEKVNIPAQAFRALVSYRNISSLHLRIIKADENLKKQIADEYADKYWPTLIAAKPERSWTQSLPVSNDLQSHSTEIKIDALPVGEYLLLAASDENLKNNKTLIGARYFYVSTISFVNNGRNYFILNRDNGQPLANAAIQVWEQKYDYKISKYISQKSGSYKADNNGLVSITLPKEQPISNHSIKLDITYGNDHLFMDEYLNDYYYYSHNKPEKLNSITSVFLFTDRSIYRPGQTIFFKGIVLTKDLAENKAAVLNKYETTVYLRDANYKTVDSLVLQTNEYGSFAGKFQLPESGLNGLFSIYTKKDNGNVSFRMEEYKRPKFYVDYAPIKGIYKVNDKIKITGLAKAYAGNNADGAMVKYRVVRQPRYFYPWMFWRWWQPPTNEMEIAHGEIKTDKDGKFIVEFSAIPDLSIDKKFEPVFDYTIYADVTDINGETRSGEKRVSVSYKSLLLKTTIPASLPADSLKAIIVRTENMNGEFEPAKISVTITSLQQEKRLIRKRYWERPDQFVMSKEEYIRNFPNDEYDNETEAHSWAKQKIVYNKSDSAKDNGQFSIDNAKLEPGTYTIEITAKDKNGEEVKDISYIELMDEKNNRLSNPQYLWTQKSKPIEPGETTSVQLGTAATDLFVVQQINKQNTEQGVYSFVKLNNEKRTFSFAATEADRGGYGVSWIFVRQNRFYQYNETIKVPWSNKDLAIEYATYRDKTLPGSEEKWKIRISGYKNEKVAAEILAGMYDASLDQFYAHSWTRPSIWSSFYNRTAWTANLNFTKAESNQRDYDNGDEKELLKDYDMLTTNLIDGILSKYAVPFVRVGDGDSRQYKKSAGREEMLRAAPTMEAAGLNFKEKSSDREEIYSVVSLSLKVDTVKTIETNKYGVNDQSGNIQVRKNFNETAFFFPELKTDSSGAIEFSFTMPEALTKWKFMALAHTKDVAFGSSTKEIVTQKQLMVQPNAPRFLREGDKMEFSSKIVNLTDKELTGQVQLLLIDPATNESLDGWFRNMFPNQYFTVAPGQSEAVKFPIDVPYLFNKALQWKIVARAGDFSDGEENAMAVLTNRMLVTESLPLWMSGTGTKTFSFDKLLNSGNSESLQNHSLTVEYTSNPAWYAVQALPYLMEYPYQCAEQTWNRYYANSLATAIANSTPKLQQVFEQWKIKDTAALLSNLQKNQELKSVLLEETPWVLAAKNENEQKKNIALLFDMIRMSKELNNTYTQLKQMQSSNGGFVWFSGGPDDRYITQYIVTGIGHLKKLKGIIKGQDDKLKQILATAIPYLDRKIKEDYDNLVKYKTNLKTYIPDYTIIQYLYMRSFFPDYEIAKASQPVYNYFKQRAQLTWTSQSKYMQGMIALFASRSGDTKISAAILKSLKETSINNEELGMYWKTQASGGWFWYQAPIETQALMIEVFTEAGKDKKTTDDLRTWLLKNKQTTNWKTTRATAEACYALLLQGNDWLSDQPTVEIKTGNTIIRSTDNTQEAGTGYFKKIIDGTKVNPDMGKIAVNVTSQLSNPPATWGAVYWQYFEDLDKITTASTPLKLVKKLFVEKNSDRGLVLTPVNEGDVVHVGDKLKVRIELRADRDMEYVHMKDMRAAGTEPVNVLSGYKWQGGLGYYESTKDASTNFFISYLRKGTYVFEYPLFVTHAGDFSNGITTIQCMYAPEFTSHSEGVRIAAEQ